jgi:tetratricopeptide (TPR) repeat protein
MTRALRRRLSAIVGFALLATGCGAARPPSTPTPEESEWETHHSLELAGRSPAAIAGYGSMCDRERPYLRACYDRARLLLESGDARAGREAASVFIARHPNDALAPSLAGKLASSYTRAGDAAGGIEALGKLADEIKGRDAADSILMEKARLEHGAGLGDQEISTLLRIVDGMDRWSSQLWDDAIWRLIELRGERAERDEERKLLERLLSKEEPSYFLGSYTTPYHDDALLRLGRLELERGAYDKAATTLLELASRDTSRLKDDGLYLAAEARVAAGRKDEACRLLARLLEDMPDASRVRDARALRERLGCGG